MNITIIIFAVRLCHLLVVRVLLILFEVCTIIQLRVYKLPLLLSVFTIKDTPSHLTVLIQQSSQLDFRVLSELSLISVMEAAEMDDSRAKEYLMLELESEAKIRAVKHIRGLLRKPDQFDLPHFIDGYFIASDYGTKAVQHQNNAVTKTINVSVKVATFNVYT